MRASALRAVGAAACASCAIAAQACEDIADVSDFRIQQTATTAPYHGPCNACPASAASLRHPPCPPTGDDAADDGEVYVYVLRKMYLGLPGVPADLLDPADYDQGIGYDLDCSSREPHGLPVLCAPINPSGAKVPWEPYPRGIDNSLSQRVFGYLEKLAAQTMGSSYQPLDVGISNDWNAGKASILMVVYNWNGTPNDSKVSYRVTSSLGTVHGVAPKWNGEDEWVSAIARPDPNLGKFEIPDTNFATDDAYVSNGVLFVDMSFLDPANAYIVNNGASLEVSMHDMTFTGKISKTEVTRWNVSALWSLNDFKNAKSDIANWLSGCNSFVSGFLCQTLPSLADEAADMPLDRTAPRTRSCDAISLSWAADAYRAHIGAYESVSAAAGCPITCQ